MVDRRREQAVDEAAARFADTLAESYRIVYEQAAEARERQGRLAQEFSERVLEHLKEQTESGRAASERLADQARRQQEAGRAFAQESVSAYMDFLDTAFSQYREGTQRAAGSAQEGARWFPSHRRRGGHRGGRDAGHRRKRRRATADRRLRRDERRRGHLAA